VVARLDKDRKKLFISVNDSLKSETDCSVTNGSNTSNFYIGKKDINDYIYFPGLMNDVRIYDQAISDEEITQLYGQYKSSLSVSTTNNALDFGGTTDYVEIANNNKLDLTDNYTIEAWIKPSAFDIFGGIVSKYHHDNANGYVLRLTGDDPYTGINFNGMYTANGVLKKNQWSHIAAVCSSTVMHVYINGVE
jgi:hypothetical protein